MNADAHHLATQLAETGHYMARSGLAWGSSGNLSARLDAETILVSASGTWFERLTPEDFVPVRLADGSASGSRKPTKELPMHLACYRVQPNTQWVLHASPFYTTLLACSELALPDECFVEGLAYLRGKVATAPYHHPGTQELGAAVQAAAAKGPIVILRNHGVIVYSTGLNDALMSLQSLEFGARLALEAQGAGLRLAGVGAAVADEFQAKVVYAPKP